MSEHMLMVKRSNIGGWAKQLALAVTLASCLAFLPVMSGYLTGSGGLLYSVYDALLVFCFSLALIVFFYLSRSLKPGSSLLPDEEINSCC